MSKKIILELLCGDYFVGDDNKVYWLKAFDDNAHMRRKDFESLERDFEAVVIASNQAQTLINQVNRILEESGVKNEEKVKAAILKISQWRRSN